jgi:hypothetical protein
VDVPNDRYPVPGAPGTGPDFLWAGSAETQNGRDCHTLRRCRGLAARSGCAGAVEMLLAAGVPASGHAGFGMIALEIAVVEGNKEVAQLLRQAEACERGDGALQAATPE